MSILRQLTEAEADLAWRDSLVLRVAEAAHHLAGVLAAVDAEFISRHTPERLAQILNSDLANNLQILQGKIELGTPHPLPSRSWAGGCIMAALL